jgi:radical SAM superfamily enzyme YgiQ (UPF0313 family)
MTELEYFGFFCFFLCGFCSTWNLYRTSRLERELKHEKMYRNALESKFDKKILEIIGKLNEKIDR